MSNFDPKTTHVAVLLGGWSPERDVSLVSGAACALALREAGYKVTEIDATPDVATVLSDLKPDVVFNALHGRWGEDGCIQGILEVLKIPYTHSGVLSSSLAMDKQKAKLVFGEVGIPCAESHVVDRKQAAKSHMMEPPYVIKPHNQGSSVGVYLIRPGDNRPPEILSSDKWDLGEEVMIEKFVAGRELTVAVMGDKALCVTEIFQDSEFYDYDAKYSDGGSHHVLPAELPGNLTDLLMDFAEKAHRALSCRGVTRTDFRFDEATGAIAILETNTQPGMTPTSLVPEQAGHGGMSFKDLVVWILEDASCDR